MTGAGVEIDDIERKMKSQSHSINNSNSTDNYDNNTNNNTNMKSHDVYDRNYNSNIEFHRENHKKNNSHTPVGSVFLPPSLSQEEGLFPIVYISATCLYPSASDYTWRVSTYVLTQSLLFYISYYF